LHNPYIIIILTVLKFIKKQITARPLEKVLIYKTICTISPNPNLLLLCHLSPHRAQAKAERDRRIVEDIWVNFSPVGVDLLKVAPLNTMKYQGKLLQLIMSSERL
jgi:hypothetical protein